MEFATPQTIKQPNGGLILKSNIDIEEKPLGARKKESWSKVNEGGHWRDFQPVSELQRNRRGDVYGCVSFSNNSAHEFIIKKQYGEEPNMSDRYLVVGSGTIPNVGNYKQTVATWKKDNFWIPEEKWPYSPDMTVDEYYNNLKVPTEFLMEGKKMSKLYVIDFDWLGDSKIQTIKDGLEFSPVQVDVQSYSFNSKGYIINNGTNYIHEVIIFDYEQGECWWVFDSENEQFIKFDWNYHFGSPMIHLLKKKFMPKLYKVNGQPAIYFLNPEDSRLVAFSDGVIAGGSLFKIFFGDYSNVPIIKVDTLPYPVANYSIRTL